MYLEASAGLGAPDLSQSRAHLPPAWSTQPPALNLSLRLELSFWNAESEAW